MKRSVCLTETPLMFEARSATLIRSPRWLSRPVAVEPALDPFGPLVACPPATPAFVAVPVTPARNVRRERVELGLRVAISSAVCREIAGMSLR